MHAQEITIQAAESHDLSRLFEISATVHATNYTELIPDDHKKEFFDHYELTQENRERYSTATQEKLLHNGYCLFKATLENGLIVGYLSGEMFDDNTFEIRSLFVDPNYQRRGIGTKLMAETIRRFGKANVQLFVIEGNRGAIALYKKYGFDFTEYDSDKVFFGAKLLHMSREQKHSLV